MGPPGGYGIGLPPGVDPMTGGGPGGGPGQGSQQEPMAIISLVLGVVAIPLWFCCGLFSLALTVVGVILGFVSLGRFNREPGRYTGKPLAIAGLVVNGLFLVVNVVLMIFFVGIMGIGILSGP
jgi:hypothetical protein